MLTEKSKSLWLCSGEVRSEKVLGDSLMGMSFFEGESAPSCGSPEHELGVCLQEEPLFSDPTLVLATFIFELDRSVL